MSSINRRSFLGTTALGTTAAVAALAGRAGAEETKAKLDVGSLGKTPHTQFAANIEMWWRKVPFLQRMEKAAEFGYPAVEFWGYQGKGKPTVEEIAAHAKKLNIKIAQFVGGGGMNDPKNEANFAKTIKASCQVAHLFDCKMMTVVAGEETEGMTTEQMHAQVTKAFKRVQPIVEREKVMLIVEPLNIRVDHAGQCLHGSVDALRICREVDSKYIKINWDLYHMQIEEGDLCGRMKEGFDQIGYFQLADHPGRHEPGTGEIHYNRVLKEAYQLGYRGYVGLECNPATTELAAARAVAAADVW